MLFKLIATAAIALGLAGFMLALHKTSRGLVPRWTILVAAAAGIFAYPIFDEYNWHSRKLAGLANAPGNFVVVGEYQSRAFWKPWTFIKAPVARIDAINTDKNQPLDGPGHLFENFIGVSLQTGDAHQTLFVFDCQNTRYAPKTDNLDTLEWAVMPVSIIQGICK